MARILTANFTKLNWIIRLSQLIPSSQIDDAKKLYLFQSAIQKAVKPYSDSIEAIIKPFSEDMAKLTSKKQTKLVQKEITDLQEKANKAVQDYVKENDQEISVTFDNEAFNYVESLFSRSANHIFGQIHKDAAGNVKSDSYDHKASGELFELLNSIK